MNKVWKLWFECILLFAGIPVISLFFISEIYLLAVPLLIILIPAFIWLLKQHGLKKSIFLFKDVALEKKYIKVLISRFIIASLLIVLIVTQLYPERLLDLPQNHTAFWLVFIFIYPFFSVYPQELLYRTFFFSRYGQLLKSEKAMILFNAAMFSCIHIIFMNATALLYTFVGGVFFAHTFLRSQSLRLVSLEHALYGILLFTVGYGQEFLTNASWQKVTGFP